MSSTTMIAGSKLKALLRFAGDKDVRYYLNGILFDHTGFAVATDGHRLMAVQIEPFDGEDYIVPSAAIEGALKSKKGMAKYRCTFVVTCTPVNLQGEIDGVPFKAIDGRFPDWKRVATVGPNGEAAEYSCQYLEEARKAIEDLREGVHVQTVHMAANGDGPGLVALTDYKETADAYMCIMPVRGAAVVEDVAVHAATFMAVRS